MLTIAFMFASAFGAIATFFLQKQGLSSVLASSLVGLLGVLIGLLFSSDHLPAVIFAGSFVGMTSLSFGTFPLVALAGIVAGFLYSISLNIFAGFGGRLGAIAFISTIVCFYLFSI